MNTTRIVATISCGLVLVNTAVTQTAPTKRSVAAPTRLDWKFAVIGFGKNAATVPAAYDSTKQTYHLFVPKGHKKDKPAGLVLFISPSDQPAGWSAWQKVCETEGILFASPFGAGNGVSAGQRTRIILDVLDDVRRQYPVDPDRTYLSGFSGGGRMACAIAFALPEYFGGVVPICGTNTIAGPAYLRHRVEERLSVAFVTGEKDFNRKENEDVMDPWFQEIGIRSKLWVIPNLGHAIPSGDTVNKIHAWLEEDLQRRRDDRKERPKLAVAADDTPVGNDQAKRMVDEAAIGLKLQGRTWRSISLLQGVTYRWGATDAGKQAQRLLTDARADNKLLERVDDEGTKDEIKSVSAQAKAMERFGKAAEAIAAWELLVKNYQGTPIAQLAADNVKRLRKK